MKQKPSLIHSFKASCQRAFSGTRNMSAPEKEIFNQEILETTQIRTMILLVLIITLQLLHIVLDMTSIVNMNHLVLQRWGDILVLVIVFMFLVLLAYYRDSSKYRLRFIIVYCCWTVLLAGAIIASYLEMTTTASIANYTIFMIAMGIIPIMQAGIGIAYLTSFLFLNIIFALNFDISSFTLSQLIIIAALAFLSYWFQYSSVIKMFNERYQLRIDNRSLRKLSETDPLTGLLNRRGMNKALRSGFGVRREGDQNILLIMLDIDYFKEYNDNYLHLAGDLCLQKIARSLQDCASRNLDVVARYGGEEFVIAVHNINQGNVVDYGKKINRAVRDLKIPFGLNADFPYITISAGLVLFQKKDKQPLKDQLIDELIDQADAQLYHAKSNGRDCISYADEIYRS